MTAIKAEDEKPIIRPPRPFRLCRASITHLLSSPTPARRLSSPSLSLRGSPKRAKRTSSLPRSGLFYPAQQKRRAQRAASLADSEIRSRWNSPIKRKLSKSPRLGDVPAVTPRSPEIKTESSPQKPLGLNSPLLDTTTREMCMACMKHLESDPKLRCTRPHAFAKCTHCEAMDEPCNPVPFPLRGPLRDLLKIHPGSEFTKKAKELNVQAEAYGKHDKEDPFNELVRVARSINRNLFRLVNLSREKQGLATLDDIQEELSVQYHAGEIKE